MSLIQTQRSSVDALDLLSGVDLVPIKPIPNVVTLQEDITTEKCRQVCVIARFSLVRFMTAITDERSSSVRLSGRSCRRGRWTWSSMTARPTLVPTGSMTPSLKVRENASYRKSWTCQKAWSVIGCVCVLQRVSLWWLSNWPASSSRRAARSSLKSSAPKTTSRSCGSSSSSSRRFRPPNHRPRETSPLRSSSSVKVKL